MIIDAHSHYIPPTIAEKTAFFKVGWSDVNRQLSLMDRNGIQKALLLYPTSDAHLNMGGWKKVCTVYNAAIAKLVREHKERFIGAGIIPGDDPGSIRGEIEHICDRGLPVFSLASSYEGKYLDDESFYQVFECAQEKNMPVHVHPQIMNPIGEDRVRDPLLTPVLEYVFDVSICIGKMMMSGTFLKFPDVKFIFAHYGGVLPLVKERFDSTYTMLRKREFVKDIFLHPSEYFKNLYFDTSGSKSIASLSCALEIADAEHILYGSDFPANQKFAESLFAVRMAPFNEAEQDLVLANPILRNL